MYGGPIGSWPVSEAAKKKQIQIDEIARAAAREAEQERKKEHYRVQHPKGLRPHDTFGGSKRRRSRKSKRSTRCKRQHKKSRHTRRR
uniref:Uncharacterized protein n=1 Tax=viral metagenome TaxID=1070528 RepID=A0A6C0HHN2_9ZZZZ